MQRQFISSGLASAALAGGHVLALAVALIAPGVAVVDALVAAARRDPHGELAVLADLQRWRLLATNSAIVVGVALLTAGIVGGGPALLIARTRWPGRAVLTAGALLAACVPVYVSGVVLFAAVPAYAISDSAVVAGVLYGLVCTPLVALLAGMAFRATDRALEEQALLDAGAPRVLRHVTLPQARWALVVIGAIVIVLVGTDFTLTDLLIVRTFAEEVYTQYALDNRHIGPLLTALPLFVVLLALALAAQARYRLLGEQSSGHAGAPPREFELGRWRPMAGVGTVVLLLALVGGPLLLLGWKVRSLEGLAGVVAGLGREVLNTAGLAMLGAALVVLPAPGLAYHLVRGRRFRWPVIVALLALLALPAPVVGISLIRVLNNHAFGWLYDSPFVLALGYYVRFLPVAVVLLVPAVRRIPRAVEDAARVDGCDGPALAWHIYRPLLLRDIAVAWLVVLILCFGEVGTTVLLAPPGWPTVSVRAFTLLHFGVYRDLAVLALLSVAAILLPWALLWGLLRRGSAAARPRAPTGG